MKGAALVCWRVVAGRFIGVRHGTAMSIIGTRVRLLLDVYEVSRSAAAQAKVGQYRVKRVGIEP
jgi:hypothetical protein